MLTCGWLLVLSDAPPLDDRSEAKQSVEHAGKVNSKQARNKAERSGGEGGIH